jgi:epoxyqueuosine reductase
MAPHPSAQENDVVNDALKSAIKQYALDQGADLVGFVSTAHLNAVTPTRYTPKRLWPEAKTAISIGKRILRGAISVGTGDSVQNARWVAWRTNEYLNRRAMDVGHFIERQGSRALPLSNGTMVDPDWTNLGIFGELSHRHVAAEAGLGTIGVPTFIVTPQFGPRIYFNTILTDIELEPDPKLDFDPCGERCDACIRACPNQAIARGNRTIKKGKCIPLAMPHGVGPLQSFIKYVMEGEVGEVRSQRLYAYDFSRLYRALVQGVGTIAGCFHCLAACPVGRELDAGDHEETNAQ